MREMQRHDTNGQPSCLVGSVEQHETQLDISKLVSEPAEVLGPIACRPKTGAACRF
jgi:hypothetical protein